MIIQSQNISCDNNLKKTIHQPHLLLSNRAHHLIESNNVKPIPDDVKQKIVDLWSEPYIKIVPVDIARAEHARELVWQYSWLSNEDAIQIASALYARVDELHTYDGVSKKGMLSLDQKLGNPPLRIVIPQYQGPDRLPGL